MHKPPHTWECHHTHVHATIGRLINTNAHATTRMGMPPQVAYPHTCTCHHRWSIPQCELWSSHSHSEHFTSELDPVPKLCLNKWGSSIHGRNVLELGSFSVTFGLSWLPDVFKGLYNEIKGVLRTRVFSHWLLVKSACFRTSSGFDICCWEISIGCWYCIFFLSCGAASLNASWGLIYRKSLTRSSFEKENTQLQGFDRYT